MVGPSLNTHHNLTLKPNAAAPTTIKFLCSYGGKILPRYPDGKLRYHGGETRVLAVDRSISFAELLVKMGELCGTSVSLRCQLPTEDLDALVSITSDEDLANLIEEYDRAASPPPSSAALKIRAFLSPPKSAKTISPPSPTAASTCQSSYSAATGGPSRLPVAAADRCIHQISKRVLYPLCYEKSKSASPSPSAAGKIPHPHYAYHVHHGNPSHIYLIHNGNDWQ